jgi:hypothetical protein
MPDWPKYVSHKVVQVAPICHVRTRLHPAALMFSVSETDAASIRAAWERGELAGGVEVRRLFPGITDHDQARECARTIAGWMPLPKPATVHRLRPRRRVTG